MAVLLLGAAAYWVSLPNLPPLTGVTRVELSGPRGRLREITRPDTASRIVALAERHYPPLAFDLGRDRSRSTRTDVLPRRRTGPVGSLRRQRYRLMRRGSLLCRRACQRVGRLRTR